MIDISNDVFDAITTALETYDSSVKTSSVYVNAPSSYPFVSIEMINNSVYERGSDDCEIENFVNTAFEINCYAKGDTRMSKAKSLLSVVNGVLESIGFTRISQVPMQDQNETLYRIVARYEGVVSKDEIVYRR